MKQIASLIRIAVVIFLAVETGFSRYGHGLVCEGQVGRDQLVFYIIGNVAQNKIVFSEGVISRFNLTVYLLTNEKKNRGDYCGEH